MDEFASHLFAATKSDHNGSHVPVQCAWLTTSLFFELELKTYREGHSLFHHEFRKACNFLFLFIKSWLETILITE